jgi:hypothetical protein
MAAACLVEAEWVTCGDRQIERCCLAIDRVEVVGGIVKCQVDINANQLAGIGREPARLIYYFLLEVDTRWSG